MTTTELPERRRRFVEAYLGQAKGNATEAARIAGYRSPGQEGHRLLKNDEIREAIDEHRESCPLKLSREALEAFWSSVIYDPDARMSDRLRASELAAKSCGMFLERPDPPKVQMTTEEAKAEILQANRVIARAGLLTAEDLGEFRVYVPDDGSGPPLLTSEAP